jgi:hypothetical protein
VTLVASIGVMQSPSRFRKNNRARCTRVFTTEMLSPRASAISPFDRPSMSRSMSTVREAAGNSSIAALSAVRNSTWSAGLSAAGPSR